MLGRNFECGACLHLFLQNCFARAMRFQCGHSMCSTAQQLVGQDMQGQALKWQLRLGTIFSVNGQQMCWFLSLLSLKFEKKNSISQETISTMMWSRGTAYTAYSHFYPAWVIDSP